MSHHIVDDTITGPKDMMAISMIDGLPSCQLLVDLLKVLPSVKSYQMVKQQEGTINFYVCVDRSERKIIEEFFEALEQGSFSVYLRVDKLGFQTENEIIKCVTEKFA